MHIWTETPVAEIWQQLRYFKPAANVKNLLTGRLSSRRVQLWPDDDETGQRSHEMASCIEQADEYFSASRTVGLATKPLMQFYGVQSLSKTVILSANPRARLAQLSYHGLSGRASTAASDSDRRILQEYASEPGRWTLEDEFAVTNEGVFPYLASIASSVTIPKGCVLRFVELVRLVPELVQLYRRHYGDSGHSFRLYDCSEPGLPFAVHLLPRDIEDVKKVFPEFETGFEEDIRHNHPGFRATDSAAAAPTFGSVVRHSVSGSYFVRPHACGVVDPLPVIFALAFILSNVVRYKPAFWMSVLQGETTGAAAIVESVCAIVERRFAHDALESIWGERFSFGSPAYLG